MNLKSRLTTVSLYSAFFKNIKRAEWALCRVLVGRKEGLKMAFES